MYIIYAQPNQAVMPITAVSWHVLPDCRKSLQKQCKNCG